jgi:hypothetical protein
MARVMSTLDRLAADVAAFRADHFPDQGIEAAAQKVFNEAWELRCNPGDDEEAADVLITLLSLQAAKGKTAADLVAAAEAKMAVNRARKWQILDDGTAQHIGPS